jgi:hypothetical protein
MGKLIGLLLALNLGVLLAGTALRHWSPNPASPAVFNAEKIRLLEAPPVTAASNPPPPAALEPVVAPDAPETARCLAFDGIDQHVFEAIEDYLKQAGIATSAYTLELEKKLGWWVFLPPLENPADAPAVLAGIQQLGISDFALVRGGSMRNAVSMGAFGQLAFARQHAATLAAKGVNGVKFGPRPESGAARLVYADRLADATLAKLRAGWPKVATPKPCAAP